jgi:hypothetical protein
MDSLMKQDLVRANEEMIRINTRYAHHRAEISAVRRAERAARRRRFLAAARRLQAAAPWPWRFRAIRGGEVSDA